MLEASPRIRFLSNPHLAREVPAAALPPPAPDVRAFHRSLPGYAATPLHALPGLAAALGLGALWVKDEGGRFGLPAFKVLGAAYAVHRWLREAAPGPGPVTLTTATAGNHGRAVAWAARTLGHRAVIFVPRRTVAARIAALEDEGAEVRTVDGTYDDAVREAAGQAAAHGWQVICDFAYPGYEEIPAWTMAGYGTLFEETSEELARRREPDPDVVLLQAGAGGLAGAGAVYYARRAGARRPRLVCVEPTEADGLLESIRSAAAVPRKTRGREVTVMAGLNAGTPSPHAWPAVRAVMHAFLAVDDGYAEAAMRRFAAGLAGDPRVVAGASGAAGLAGLLALVEEPALAEARRDLGLGAGTRVLLVVSEGATDPEHHRAVLGAVP